MSNKKTILIVDDNRVNRKLLFKILNGEYKILQAENGSEALDVLHKYASIISAVLLDIVMPIMDGYDVLKQLQHDPVLSSIPIIVTTGNTSVDAEDKALSLGANDFLTKPYKPSIIKHRLANTIKLRETAAFIHSVEKDEVTGVLNKEFFYKHAETVLRENADKKYDIICMDIERFKLVNDLFGTKVGDDLLNFIAEKIQNNVEGYGICGRIGGDKFASLVPHQEAYSNQLFEDAMSQINLFPIDIDICISFGIYVVDNATVSVNAMCDRALLACNSIKGKYDTHYAFYDDQLIQALLSEQSMVDGMKKAITEKQFQVYYQPKYELQTEKVAGAEALVRWIHPEKGFIFPGKFIPLFEKNGFITELDIYVWETVCQHLQECMVNKEEVVPISVNVSRADIYNPRLPDILLDLIHKYNIEPQYLHLEITETAYTENPSQLIEMVESLKAIGFIIEMDDFGSGYSSLNMLSELPIDILKLDIKFIQNESVKNSSRSILSFVISLAKWLNLPVVAEGVETKEQLDILRNMDCNYVQGYYYAKPMDATAFKDHLKRNAIDSVSINDIKKTRSLHHVTIKKSQSSKIMMIVDDIELNRTILSEIFAELYTTVEADNGQAAYEYIKNNAEKIDIILLDLVMPIMDGFDLLAKLKADNRLKHIPVIVTSHGNDDSEARALTMGAADFICKPYNVEVALTRVKNVLAEGRLEKMEEETLLVQKMREMEHKATLDGLTRLYNRTEFEARISDFFQNAPSLESTFIILDIDNFKLVNDQLGHAKGDEALKKVARLLKRCFREDDLICRLGGDEFAIFMPAHFTEEDLNHRLDTLCARLKFNIDKMEVTCSIGACTSPSYGKEYQTLYQNADMALLTAKRLGKNQYQIFGAGVELPSYVLFRNMDWLMDEASDAVLVCDAQSYDLLYLNDVACQIAGRSKKECMGKKCYEVLFHESAPCSHCVHIDELSRDYCEHEISPVGTDKYYIVKGKLVDWGGKQARIQYIQDNTYKAILNKQMLAVSQDRKRLLDLMPGGIFRYHTGTDAFDFVSENMLKLLGYTRDQFDAKFKNQFSNLVWHEDRARVLHEIETQIASSDVDECDYRIEKSDGSLCWVHDIGHLVHDDDGTDYFYVTIIDITESHEMQEELIESKQKLAIALNHSGLQYWEHDLITDTAINGVKGANLGFADITPNYSRFLIESGIIPHEYIALYQQKQQELYDGAEYVSYTIPLVAPDGRQIRWHIHCTNLFDHNGKPIKTIGTAENMEKWTEHQQEASNSSNTQGENI